MKYKTYLVLLVDREHAQIFLLLNGAVGQMKELKDDYVRKTVKHVGGVRDARDKVSRRIELQLTRHLTNAGEQAGLFAEQNGIDALVIGTHKPLFGKIKKNLPDSLRKKLMIEFVTELKGPFGDILKKVEKEIRNFEEVKIDEK
ncbi:MAG: hypothetical protein AAB478_04860 [Patescibacteria group bacterium]